MKTLLATTAIAAVFALAGPVSAQMYQPMNPMPMPSIPYQATSGAPGWMMDDGSSSDHPIHNPGDVSGERLNSQYRNGIYTAPGTGFPAQWDQR
jgi:hypothetical protein